MDNDAKNSENCIYITSSDDDSVILTIDNKVCDIFALDWSIKWIKI